MKYVLATLLVSLIAAGDTAFAFASASGGTSNVPSPEGPCACGPSCRCGPASCCGPNGAPCARSPERTPAPAKLAPASNEGPRRAASDPLPRHLGALCLLAPTVDSRRAAWRRALVPSGSPPGDRPLYLLDSALLL